MRTCRRCGHEAVKDRSGRVVDLHDCGRVLAIAEVLAEAEAQADKSFSYVGEARVDQRLRALVDDRYLDENGGEGRAWSRPGGGIVEKVRADVWNGMYTRAVDRLLADKGVHRARGDR